MLDSPFSGASSRFTLPSSQRIVDVEGEQEEYGKVEQSYRAAPTLRPALDPHTTLKAFIFRRIIMARLVGETAWFEFPTWYKETHAT